MLARLGAYFRSYIRRDWLCERCWCPVEDDEMRNWPASAIGCWRLMKICLECQKAMQA